MSENINGDKNKINSEINTGILSENIAHHLLLAVRPFFNVSRREGHVQKREIGTKRNVYYFLIE